MSEIKCSMCAAAIRPQFWEEFLNSLKGNTIKYEVLFAGDVRPTFDTSKYPELKYVYTTVKPTQCYSAMFKMAQGELIGWTADDATYNYENANNLDIAYNFYKSFNDEKVVIAMHTIEDHHDVMNNHHLFGKQRHTPFMAPFGLMNREYFHKIGGYDKNFITGQAENDVVMRVLEDGGRVERCMNSFVNVDHVTKHDWSDNAFRKFYPRDRIRLENCWVEQGYGAYDKKQRYTISKKRLFPVEPYKDEDILIRTQGEKGKWE